jgi:hypothetical protein
MSAALVLLHPRLVHRHHAHVGGNPERLTVQFSTRLLYNIIMIRRGAEVPRLPDITDTRVLLLIATADVGGAVSRDVIGNDQLEVFLSLSKQGFK